MRSYLLGQYSWSPDKLMDTHHENILAQLIGCHCNFGQIACTCNYYGMQFVHGVWLLTAFLKAKHLDWILFWKITGINNCMHVQFMATPTSSLTQDKLDTPMIKKRQFDILHAHTFVCFIVGVSHLLMNSRLIWHLF